MCSRVERQLQDFLIPPRNQEPRGLPASALVRKRHSVVMSLPNLHAILEAERPT